VRVELNKKKKVIGKVWKERALKFSRSYRQQFCYLVQLYDPELGVPVGVIPVRTQPTFEAVLEEAKNFNLYPLVLPQPVYIPQSFWEEYRRAETPEERSSLVKEYGLLQDASIYRFKTVVVDVDSNFEVVYPVWEELRERLALRAGYQVYRTKSGRFRAYIYLSDGTKDLKRAKELLAIIYAFFERRGLKADRSFVWRLNHPVFYEEFPLYSYELVEEAGGGVAFFPLYRKVKRLQREFSLWTFEERNLTEEFWGLRAPQKKHGGKCRIVKAPAFKRRLERDFLDNFELWKRAVISLAQKHSSYRYYVIQPAVGWAKYLVELPRDEVIEFLVELLGEEKRKDVEKGWKYARELEFNLPDSVCWAGRTREEWEGIVIAELQFRGSVSRQELLKSVFFNQKWLCDLVMEGLIKKGAVVSNFVIYGRGRPRKVFSLAEEMRVPLRKAVGCEWITQAALELSTHGHNKQNFVVEGRDDFSQHNNSLFERAIGGGWDEKRNKKFLKRDRGSFSVFERMGFSSWFQISMGALRELFFLLMDLVFKSRLLCWLRWLMGDVLCRYVDVSCEGDSRFCFLSVSGEKLVILPAGITLKVNWRKARCSVVYSCCFCRVRLTSLMLTFENSAVFSG